MYKDFSKVFSIEQFLDSKLRNKQKEEFENMKEVICRSLLALNEQRSYKDTPKRHYLQYC
jgi:hypothetical protein